MGLALLLLPFSVCCQTFTLPWSRVGGRLRLKTSEMDSEKSKTEDRDLPEKSPKRGPTLSTSTSSFEALDPHDPQLNHLASVMFSKTSDWIAGELESTTEEYRLLEQMNQVTLTKYSDMQQITENISKGATDLNIKYSELLPYLEQVDQIDSSVERLEQAAYKLDAYSKRLEQKFKTLEKRTN